jgi:hypothetical protein
MLNFPWIIRILLLETEISQSKTDLKPLKPLNLLTYLLRENEFENKE